MTLSEITSLLATDSDGKQKGHKTGVKQTFFYQVNICKKMMVTWLLLRNPLGFAEEILAPVY
jgi:hypothetical protein